MAKVGVVGLGAMGSRIARRLLDSGHELVVWNRDPARTEPLTAAGAVAAESPADAARQAEAVITMVSNPDALGDVTEGPAGVGEGLTPPTTLIQMSTVGMEATERLAAALPCLGAWPKPRPEH
jgi:3-hydroxyisobutyrate dehydrogenase-like beta-hydroxyacid dehydrogenase